MADSTICKWNKYSHCRYGRFCLYKHENKRCQEPDCDARQCNLRHPRPCRNIVLGRSCPFGKICSFDHGDTNYPREDADETLVMKVKELENLLESKNLEIKELLASVDAMNSVIGVDESDSEDASDHSIETVTDDDEQEMNTFVCDKCDFITKKKAGLKIHSSKAHPKIKCNNCLREFSTKEKLNRHVEVENILENICDKVNKKEDLELKEIDPDE